MLSPDEKTFIAAQGMQNAGVLNEPPKKPEGLIQARTAVEAPLVLPGYRDVPFCPDEVIPPSMNSLSGPLRPNHPDHMTPEQIGHGPRLQHTRDQICLPGFAGMVISETEGQMSPTLHPDHIFLESAGQTTCQKFQITETSFLARGLSAEMFQQQLAEKFQGGLPGISITGIRSNMEMTSMIPGSQ
eukprot:bmy_18459T0